MPLSQFLTTPMAAFLSARRAGEESKARQLQEDVQISNMRRAQEEMVLRREMAPLQRALIQERLRQAQTNRELLANLPGGDLRNLTSEQATRLVLSGAIKASDLDKLVKMNDPSLRVIDGSIYGINPRNASVTSVHTPSLDQYSKRKEIEARARAQFDTVTVELPNGRKQVMTQAQASDYASRVPGAKIVEPIDAMPTSPIATTPPISPIVDGGAAERLRAETGTNVDLSNEARLRSVVGDLSQTPDKGPNLPGTDLRSVLLQELANEEKAGNAANAAQIRAELARLPQTMPQQPTSQTGLPGFTTGKSTEEVLAEKRRGAAIEMEGKEAAKFYGEGRQKMSSLASTARILKRLQGMTMQDKTFANAGATYKAQASNLAQALGITINVDKLANSEQYIAMIGELMKERLASRDYGSGTGISNLDLIAASVPLPELSKSKNGRLMIIDGLRKDIQEKMEDIQAYRSWYETKQSDMRGFRYPSENKTMQRLQQMEQIEQQRLVNKPRNAVGQEQRQQAPRAKFLGFE